MTAIGELRFRLEFLSVIESDDGEGGQATAPQVEITVDGGVRPASAREIDAAGRLQQRLTHVGVIRWRPDFTPRNGMAVRWTDRANRVRTAYVAYARDPDERGRFLELGLAEGAPAKAPA